MWSRGQRVKKIKGEKKFFFFLKECYREFFFLKSTFSFFQEPRWQRMSEPVWTHFSSVPQSPLSNSKSLQQSQAEPGRGSWTQSNDT